MAPGFTLWVILLPHETQEAHVCRWTAFLSCFIYVGVWESKGLPLICVILISFNPSWLCCCWYISLKKICELWQVHSIKKIKATTRVNLIEINSGLPWASADKSQGCWGTVPWRLWNLCGSMDGLFEALSSVFWGISKGFYSHTPTSSLYPISWIWSLPGNM